MHLHSLRQVFKMAWPRNQNGQQKTAEEEVLEATAFTSKAKGRPRSRWIDALEEDMKNLGIQNWKEIANDRNVRGAHVQQAKAHKLQSQQMMMKTIFQRIIHKNLWYLNSWYLKNIIFKENRLRLKYLGRHSLDTLTKQLRLILITLINFVQLFIGSIYYAKLFAFF